MLQAVCSGQLEALGGTYALHAAVVNPKMGICTIFSVQFGCQRRVPSRRTMFWIKARTNT